MPLDRWPGLAKAYIAFGQGISITPLQLASAFGVVANGGRLIGPYVVDGIGSAEGLRRLHPEPLVRGEAISATHRRGARGSCSPASRWRAAPARRRRRRATRRPARPARRRRRCRGAATCRTSSSPASPAGRRATARLFVGAVVIDDPQGHLPRRRGGGAGLRRDRAARAARRAACGRSAIARSSGPSSSARDESKEKESADAGAAGRGRTAGRSRRRRARDLPGPRRPHRARSGGGGREPAPGAGAAGARRGRSPGVRRRERRCRRRGAASSSSSTRGPADEALGARRASWRSSETSGTTPRSSAFVTTPAKSARGDLFVAWRGAKHDGASFAGGRHRARRGSGDRRQRAPRGGRRRHPLAGRRRRRARLLGALAAPLYGHPDRALRLVGVTGTNGKSTTVELMRRDARRGGLALRTHRHARLPFPGRSLRSPASARRRKRPISSACSPRCATSEPAAVAMEVSSHALAQGRVAGASFDGRRLHQSTRAITSTSIATSRTTSRPRRSSSTQLDARRPRGGEHRRSLWPPPRGVASRRGRPSAAAGAVAPAGVTLDAQGMRGELATPRGPLRFESPLLGRYNLLNVLAAAAAGEALGLPHAAIAAGLAATRPLPGRMEPVDAGQGFLAVVDYAHTDAALEAAIRSLQRALGAARGGGLRLRRRSRPGQAPADGHASPARSPSCRSSPPTTRAARIRSPSSRRSRKGCARRATSRTASSPTAARRSAARSRWRPAAAGRCWWPARGTSASRSSATAASPSRTAKRSSARWRIAPPPGRGADRCSTTSSSPSATSSRPSTSCATSPSAPPRRW